MPPAVPVGPDTPVSATQQVGPAEPVSQTHEQTVTMSGRPAGEGGEVEGRLHRRLARFCVERLRSRLEPGRQAVFALLVVAALAAVVAGVLTVRPRPVVEPVPPPVLTATAVRTTSATSRSIVVAVAGKVRHPGLVTLHDGARVADAVRAAGGPARGADIGLLNLARRLTDGEQVVVGVPDVPGAAACVGCAGEPTGAAGTDAAPTRSVNLNTATATDLDTLPGIGPVTAARIVDWRTRHGPFVSVDQLREVPGIGPSKLARIRELVTL